MSWNDPCRDCGESKRDCTCTYEPRKYSQEEINERDEKHKLAKETCAKEGHIWEYGFIIYTCKRCGESTEY